jgi:hypothetical protein
VQLGSFGAHEIFREWSDGWLPTATPASPAQLREAFDEATVGGHQSQIIKVVHSMAWITEPIDGGREGSPVLVQVLANTGLLIFRSGYATVCVDAEGYVRLTPPSVRLWRSSWHLPVQL